LKSIALQDFIFFSLHSDGCIGAVAGDYFDVVWKGHEAVVDRFQYLLSVASG
jgi:hypothetical protein